MLEANRRLGDYLANPTMPFQLWLRHMARDRLIDAHRRHRVAASRSPAPPTTTIPPPMAWRGWPTAS